MTEHNEAVERQRLLLEAEEWAQGLKDLHVHSLSSMWYDDRPQDTEGGQCVTDRAYNNGVIERYKAGKLIHVFGERLTGQALLDQYSRHSKA
jgi:hypothetical protein